MSIMIPCKKFFLHDLIICFFHRVSIEELYKHTELDTDRENEFTVEEARVSYRSNAGFIRSNFLVYSWRRFGEFR